MRDLIEAVQFEHRRVLELVDDILGLCGEGRVGERRARKPIDALVALESRHEAAEARYLWPVVRDVLPEQVVLREAATAQEKRARQRLHLLHRIAGRDGSAPLAAAIAQDVVTHVGLEESQILPSLASSLDPDDSVRIGRMYEQASRSGPTRPHPRTPAIPGVLALVSPAAARMDRVRDLLRLR